MTEHTLTEAGREVQPATCPDCGVLPYVPHHGGCDVARCLWTGHQRIQCDGGFAAACCRALRAAGHNGLADNLAYYLSLDDPDHACGDDIWTGEWPGVADAREMDIWVRWGPPWIECSRDHPEARPDLNGLHKVGRWDSELAKWVKR